MPNCYFCKDKVDDIPYRCTFCGMVFCGNHRLPENHECPFDLKGKSMKKDSLEHSEVFYQDALDFLDKDLSVAKIYEYVTTKKIRYTISLGASYKFSKNIYGGLTSNYEWSDDRKRDQQISTFSLSIWIEIMF